MKRTDEQRTEQKKKVTTTFDAERNGSNAGTEREKQIRIHEKKWDPNWGHANVSTWAPWAARLLTCDDAPAAPAE